VVAADVVAAAAMQLGWSPFINKYAYTPLQRYRSGGSDSAGWLDAGTSLVDRRPRSVAAGVVLLCTTLGSVVSKAMMNLTWIEAIYFSVSTITTVRLAGPRPTRAQAELRFAARWATGISTRRCTARRTADVYTPPS
jgi:hypothetical protein